MFKRTYKRNIPLLAGLEFTSYFGITSFWILFFIQNGLSLLQIGLLESIFMGQVSCVKSHLACWQIDLATRPISIWLAWPVLYPLS